MNLNLSSPVFWSTIAGGAATALGAIDPTGKLGTAVQACLVGVGGIILFITTHHTVKAQVAAKVK
jgi:hypothetical protein